MPDDLTSTVGVIAIAAAAAAAIALLVTVLLAIRLRRVRIAQKAVLGGAQQRDLVIHAESLQARFEELQHAVDQTFAQFEQRLGDSQRRLDNAISRTAVVRYDAYNEMSGRQSSSMALLDDLGTGVVLSSILHRDQARLYVKGVRDGRSEFELSPEENEAIQAALSTAPAAVPVD